MSFNGLAEAPERGFSLITHWNQQYGLCHVHLADDGGYALASPPVGLIVFWWLGRPVAHRWCADGGSEPLAGQIDSHVLELIAAEEQRAGAAQLGASVVICTRDRPDELRRCLASLPQQTWQAREVIVVDNASIGRRTRDVAHEAGAIYLREERPGLDFARNTGARAASSPILAYTDDDVLLHPTWLERLVAAFDTPTVAAVTGLVLPAELATDAQEHFEKHWSFGRGYLRQDFDTARFAQHRDDVFPAWEIGAGASMAFRREIFERIGYFDERLDVGQAGCSGDSEFWYRVLAHGLSCRYEPRAVAFHVHRRTLDGLASQIHHYMRGHAVALLVQWERTGIAANRRQAWLGMPRWYAGRLWHRLRGLCRPQDRFLREEVLGYLSGLLFYLRHRREGS
ncbi:glycosyltransferase family 2 protein [Synechococcus sp. CS-1327]|uniref:glycosyltransferase family 2 protein n=1 Tax=Synechococcus sp. CS-1327 TaxID=2847977 RepID=UPI00223B5D6F|nr:glycosyltransferase [Synechococcus sp. CS-1327]MCT0234533.1 glycosyltransferase [Synechococcus sp. CS-1327]